MEPVKPNINFDKNHVDPILGINLFNQQYEKSLDANREQQEACTKHKEELCSVRSHLETLPNELSYDVMIPIGSQGLMRGKMVHTNEILALIGDGWYVKTSANNAVKMCQRRIERCEETLSNYVKEFELLKSWRGISHDVFQPPSEDVREIFEDFDEEKEKDWRAVHRENVRKHYLELAKLRNKEKNATFSDEETLKQRLDELELQEEMEDELLRSGEDLDKSSSDSDESSGAENNTKDKESDSLNSSGASYAKRKVSFAEVVQELDLDAEEEKPKPLRIFFHHSDVPVRTSKEDGEETGIANSSPSELGSPSDVYTHFASLFPSKTIPKGILKQTSMSSSVEENGDSISNYPFDLSESLSKPYASEMGDPDNKHEDGENDYQLISQAVAFGDVIVEHNPVVEIQVHEEQAQVTRPVSRFKASRQKQKLKEK